MSQSGHVAIFQCGDKVWMHVCSVRKPTFMRAEHALVPRIRSVDLPCE